MLGQVCFETVKEIEHLGRLGKDGRIIQNGARKSSPGLSANGNNSCASNKRTTHVTQHLKSYFVVVKECYSGGIPAARGAAAIG